MSCEFHDAADGVCHAIPFPRFHSELTPSRAGEAVIPGAAPQLRDLPLGLDPTLVFETMKGRIKRALTNLQDVLGNLLDALGDGPAVQRVVLQRSQDQQIKGAGQ